jgi:type III restriction enzyme
MNNIALQINNRLSLRSPQSESLDRLSKIIDVIDLNKNADLAVNIQAIKNLYPTFEEFEREFPSVCFSLATGVGKTRLMGAFIVYLMRAKGIKNFFVLAPNLTIYNKLIEDFGSPTHSKYVFKGISEFAMQAPKIITGDNYQYQGGLFDDKDGVHINVFNISKINSEVRGGKSPKIKRLSEYLGESYFDYLASLDDLVVLMDESHHYRAAAGMKAINELKPIIGLEVTATPQIESGNKSIKFKNVVFEYSLSKAIKDGFVKEPSVATRKNFDPTIYKDNQAGLDKIKIEDGIRLHEDTKVALEIYAKNSRTNTVKPFVLIVAKDTTHASEIKAMIQSNSFFEGRYKDKVIEVHSNQAGEEKDETIAQLVAVEDPNNTTEIVIHVNMLKEGWDVTNLYTIIPLRTAASLTLREQTIGRGLRLPYGRRTGNDKVDKLTIVSHDKFQQIIEEANKPDSIIKKENIIEIDEEDLSHPKEVVTSENKLQEQFQKEKKEIEKIEAPEEKQKATIVLEAKKSILENFTKPQSNVVRISDLRKEEIKQQVIEKIKENKDFKEQLPAFQEVILKQVEEAYDELVEEFITQTIEIPRITIQPSEEVIAYFKDFDFDASKLNHQPVAEEILVQKLRTNEQNIVIGKGRITQDRPENKIVNELINFPEIDYDSTAELLFKLTSQALDKYKSYLEDDEVMNVVDYNTKNIAELIYTQMMENFHSEPAKFEQVSINPFVKIEPHNFTKFKADSIHDFNDTISPVGLIKMKVFSGFRKACHNLYKFDSKTEKDFSIIVENDPKVLKWLRPASNQFRIYWNHNSKQYEPDFIVETDDSIYMVETKKADDIKKEEVQDKKRAALQYCNYASKYAEQNDGKQWKYMIIPHGEVQFNKDFGYFISRFVEEYKIQNKKYD